MGARFLAAALVFSSAWYAWQWHSSLQSIRAVTLRVMGWSFLAAFAGKVVGILVFRAQRAKRSSAPHRARL
jgi:hypothetical protein